MKTIPLTRSLAWLLSILVFLGGVGKPTSGVAEASCPVPTQPANPEDLAREVPRNGRFQGSYRTGGARLGEVVGVVGPEAPVAPGFSTVSRTVASRRHSRMPPPNTGRSTSW